MKAGSLNGGGFAVDSVLTVEQLSVVPSATDSTTVICWNMKDNICSGRQLAHTMLELLVSTETLC